MSKEAFFCFLFMCWAIVQGHGSINFKNVLLSTAVIRNPTKATHPVLTTSESPSRLLDYVQNLSIDKDLSGKKASIVSLIGFNHSNINCETLKKNVEESLLDVSTSLENYAIFSTEIPSDLSWEDIKGYSGGNVAVIYISSASESIDIGHPLWATQLQALLDANEAKMKSPFSIVLLMDVNLNGKEKSQAEQLVNMVISTHSMSKHGADSNRRNNKNLFISPFSFDSYLLSEEAHLSQEKQKLRNILQQSITQSSLKDIQSVKVAVQHYLKEQANKSQKQFDQSSANAREYLALNKAVSLTNLCLDAVQSILLPYTSSSDIYQSQIGNGILFSASSTFPEEIPPSLKLFLQDISKQVMSTVQEHHRVFVSEYDSLLKLETPVSTMREMLINKFKVLTAFMERCMVLVLREEIKLEFEHQVQQFVRQTLASANEGMITDGKDLKRMLEKLRSMYLKHLQKMCSYLHSEFELMAFNASSVLTNDVLSTKNKSIKRQFSFPCPFDTQHKHLSTTLQQLQEETLLSLQLSGGVNPYLRTHPFPPLHINMNYLVDPRAYEISREFDRLYDVHQDGVYAPGRAEAMIFPGMASIPFNPHERAIPKSSISERNSNLGPWQRMKTIVSSFFADDEEEEEEENKVGNGSVTKIDKRDDKSLRQKQLPLFSWGEKKDEKEKQVISVQEQASSEKLSPSVSVTPTKSSSPLSNRSFGRYGEILRKKRLEELEKQQEKSNSKEEKETKSSIRTK